ncbi:MAG: alpha/beta hydrolase fold domain-containing protein, partial [Hyphomonadaceae bacterium]
MASPEFHALLASMRATPRPEDPTMQEQREGHEKLALSFPPPETVSVKKDVAGALPVEWLTPKDVSSDAVILYFHGGGYCLGSLDTHRGLTARLAEAAKTQALCVGYRLAPEDQFPAAVD